LADIAPLDAATTVITDDGLPDEAHRALTDVVGSVLTVDVSDDRAAHAGAEPASRP
jgi:hypothetical protein